MLLATRCRPSTSSCGWSSAKRHRRTRLGPSRRPRATRRSSRTTLPPTPTLSSWVPTRPSIPRSAPTRRTSSWSNATRPSRRRRKPRRGPRRCPRRSRVSLWRRSGQMERLRCARWRPTRNSRPSGAAGRRRRTSHWPRWPPTGTRRPRSRGRSNETPSKDPTGRGSSGHWTSPCCRPRGRGRRPRSRIRAWSANRRCWRRCTRSSCARCRRGSSTRRG
mmetsp:Transcript_8100/g.26720  ORF Transcript_8100/g.26720 Transcript_8100/m.26720 type:complete len:219 (-) Transcript_8100:580-1236(-)